MGDSLSPKVAEPLLRGRFGKPYRYEVVATTTQELVGPADPEGAVAVAEAQTAGRGRFGRRWDTPTGAAIQVSIVLRPPSGPAIVQLALVGGLAVAETAEAALAAPVQIKWPNDVLVAGCKIAGVLAEAREGVVVLGIGLNVNQTAGQLPEGTRLPPGSLRTVDGQVRERAPILADLLVRLERRYDVWCKSGLEAVVAEIESRDFLRGKRVRVDGIEGIASGLDRDGRLLVGGVPVESGEIEFVR